MKSPGFCACSPYTLIISMIESGIRSRSRIEKIASIVYNNSCWELKDLQKTLDILLRYGLLIESNGMLSLNLKHPDDIRYSRIASEYCKRYIGLVT